MVIHCSATNADIIENILHINLAFELSNTVHSIEGSSNQTYPCVYCETFFRTCGKNQMKTNKHTPTEK